MSSTLITTNSDALSRAADAILAREGNLSKNAILNALAVAITGPGHDWGFIKNAPSDIVQPGLDRPCAGPAVQAAAKAWVLQYDERDDWSREPMLFKTKDAALQYVIQDQAWWQHPDHPADVVLKGLTELGEYTFHNKDDDDASPYCIHLREAVIAKAEPEHTPVDPAPQPGAKSPLVFFEAPAPYREQGLDWGLCLFEDEKAVLAYVRKHNLDADCPDWQSNVKSSEVCDIEAHFKPQIWINDYACEADPEGNQTWKILAEELDPTSPDLDYLKHSRNAPDWVKAWTGPFDITLSIK